MELRELMNEDYLNVSKSENLEQIKRLEFLVEDFNKASEEVLSFRDELYYEAYIKNKK